LYASAISAHRNAGKMTQRLDVLCRGIYITHSGVAAENRWFILYNSSHFNLCILSFVYIVFFHRRRHGIDLDIKIKHP
jgi:hypothetical protein